MEQISTDTGFGKCIIVADGMFPKSETTLSLLRKATYICCCDGAVRILDAIGIKPNAIVGDGDSLSPEARGRFKDILFLEPEDQDTNDLTKATRHCARQGFKEIIYLGATGLREDHSIANIFLLAQYLTDYQIHGKIITDYGIFQAFDGDTTLNVTPGTSVSVFNISCKHLSATGLHWPIHAFKRMWEGTLNRADSNQIRFEADGCYIVYTAFAENKDN